MSSTTTKDKARVDTYLSQEWDVSASVQEMRENGGSDGAYDLIGTMSAAELVERLRDILSGDWGLCNAEGPVSLRITIAPKGTIHDE